MAYDMTKDRYPVPGAAGGPGRKAAVVVPADGTDLDPYAVALYVGVGGNLTVTPAGNVADTGILFSNVPAGWFPVQVRRVWSTGTTATNMVAIRD